MGHDSLADRCASLAAHTKCAVRRVALEARSSIKASNISDLPFLSFSEEERYEPHHTQVRCPNDVSRLEITVIDNASGPGVVVSALGPGSAAEAGINVGDVIVKVNHMKVASHEQAIAALHHPGQDIVFTVAGMTRKVVINKSQPGKLEITLSNRRTGEGVEVSAVGILGLIQTAGIEVGDVILSINGVLVTDHAQAIALLDSTEGFIEIVVSDKPPANGLAEAMMYPTAFA